MTDNKGRITRLGTVGEGITDTEDKMHSGIIKALWNTATGSRVVNSGTLTQLNGVFTLAHPTVFRSEGTKITLSTGSNDNEATLGNNTGSNDRYDLLYIDKSANSNLGQLSIAAGTFNVNSPKIADLAKEDVPIAIIKVPSGTSSLTGVTFEFQLLMSTFDKDVLDDDEVTYAKIQNVSATNRILGRDSSGAGVIEEITPANLRTMINVDDGADVTDATNVNAAGAIMHSDIPDSDTGFVKRTGSETYDIDTNTYITSEQDTLQLVTGRGSTTTNNITAASFIKTSGTSSQFLKADGSSDSSTYLTVESDTLDSVTGRGNTTAHNITVGDLISGNLTSNHTSITRSLTLSKAGTLDTETDAIVNIVNASQNTPTHQMNLPAANLHDGKVFYIKNVNAANTLNVVTADVFENNFASSDPRYVSPTTLALKPLESVIIQAYTDGLLVPTAPAQNIAQGWLILDTYKNTNTGILNVVDDSTPQLGGNLDVSGHKITSASNGNVEIEPNGTGDIILDADVTVDKAHSFLAAKLPNATKTTSTLSDSDAGKYLFVSITGQTITLPASHVAGEHYTILANGYDVTLSSSDNMNGSTDNITIVAYSGVTCISDGTDWIVLGA